VTCTACGKRYVGRDPQSLTLERSEPLAT